MRKTVLLGLLLVSSIAVAGCNVSVTAPKAGNQSAPAAGNAAAPATPAAPATSAAPGGETPAAAQQNFTINNQTGHVVTTLNVSASSENQWGPDILGRDVLANGESAEIAFERGETQCLWDIRATYDDGGTTDARGVNLCEVATVNLTAE